MSREAELYKLCGIQRREIDALREEMGYDRRIQQFAKQRGLAVVMVPIMLRKVDPDPDNLRGDYVEIKLHALATHRYIPRAKIRDETSAFVARDAVMQLMAAIEKSIDDQMKEPALAAAEKGSA